MIKHARLTQADASGTRMVIEVVEGDPGELFHPLIAEEFIAVPVDTVPGSALTGADWTHPAPAETVDAAEPVAPPLAPRRMTLSPPEYLLQFSSAERVAIRAVAAGDTEAAPVIADWLAILADPRLTAIDLDLPSTREGHAFLVSIGLITAARRAEIEAGVPA